MTDILIVVDDKEISSLLTDFLWVEGFVVSAAVKGQCCFLKDPQF